MKKIIERILKVLSRSVLKRQKPWIVTVTGSIGKTSTKEAVYAVLSNKFRTRRNIKNYNNELGVPLTIIGSKSAGRNIVGWKIIFWKAILLSLFKRKNYPEVLVLEIGADKPGDLKYLMEILPKELLKACLLTAVAPVHLEFFKTMDKIFEEKTTPFQYLPDAAIVNKDCVDFEKVQCIAKSKLISYALMQNADVRAEGVRIEQGGASFHIGPVHFLLKGAVSEHQIYAMLAGISVGLEFNMGMDEIKKGLNNYQVLAGRMKQIEGINKSIIIDDTYNSSPEAARKALKAVMDLPFGKKKIAVLGDMLELGKNSKDFHYQIGQWAKQLGFKHVLTFGPEAKHMEGRHFENMDELINSLKELITEGDVVLIKGSQGMRMEKITKALMTRPQEASEMLVRQSKEWL